VTRLKPRSRVNRAHPRVRGGIVVRSGSLLVGLFLFALGIVLILESDLGLSPWDVLNQGIARHSPLSFGIANVAVALVVLLVAWALGSQPGVGTFANAILIGLYVQALLSLGFVNGLVDSPLALRVVFLVAGISSVGIGSSFYIGADLGAGPRDSLMLVGARRTGRRIGVVRAVIELCVLVAGIALDGDFGIGTLAFAFFVGPAVEVSFALLSASPLAARVPASSPVILGE
jgi:uncharacterized protein